MILIELSMSLLMDPPYICEIEFICDNDPSEVITHSFICAN